jgi:hypothetical protein
MNIRVFEGEVEVDDLHLASREWVREGEINKMAIEVFRSESRATIRISPAREGAFAPVRSVLSTGVRTARRGLRGWIPHRVLSEGQRRMLVDCGLR